MSALLRIGRALARAGRHLLYADRASCCCSPCALFWRAIPCDNPGACAPFVCELFICQGSGCCDTIPPTPVTPGSVVQWQGWCYTVQPGDVPAASVPAGAPTFNSGDFCARRIFCIPGNCSHPACNCTPGPWLYWQACPCPSGGDGVCRVIRQEDYAALAAALGSDCVVGSPGPEVGCLFVSSRSPRADTLPPGCSIYVPAISQVVSACCECCAGCSSVKITAADCTAVRALNPDWFCYPSTCCCQRINLAWTLAVEYRDPTGFGFVKINGSGSGSADLYLNPGGAVVPATFTFEDQSSGGPFTVEDSILVRCGAHLITPPGSAWMPLGRFPWQPVAPGRISGPDGYQEWVQSGDLRCDRYSVAYREDNVTFGVGAGYITFHWSVTVTRAPGGPGLCDKGCTGASVTPAAGPCGQLAGDSGDGFPVGTGAFI